MCAYSLRIITLNNASPDQLNASTPQTDFSTLEPASIFRRLAALFYDSFLMAAISLVYALILKAFTWLNILTQGEGTDLYTPITDAIIMIGWWAALAYYYCYCWGKRGQTLAMKAWRIRLQQPDGSLATPKQSWLRAILAPLSLLSVIGYLWCLFDAKKDCLHDKITKTRVVTLPKNIN